MDLSFKQYVRVMEDVSDDIARVQADLALVDTQINQRVAPLQQRKVQLQKRLALLQKQSQADIAKKPMAQQQQNADQAAPNSNQTTTPGSTGAATPGVGG